MVGLNPMSLGFSTPYSYETLTSHRSPPNRPFPDSGTADGGSTAGGVGPRRPPRDPLPPHRPPPRLDCPRLMVWLNG